jgi:hypothetical protein
MMSMLLKLALELLLAYAAWRFLRNLMGGAPPRPPRPAKARPRAVEDLAECATCRTFMGVSAPACGRPDCPRRT